MRITKANAEHISEMLTAKKTREAKKHYQETKDYVSELAKSTITKEVMDAFMKYRSYFKTASSLKIYGPGTNHETVSLGQELPCKDGYCIQKTLTAAESKKIIGMLEASKDKKKEIDALRKDIEETVLALGTHQKIKDSFKEAAAHLWEKQNTALIVNVESLRKRL